MTFRDMGGMWEQYDVMEVASPQGWEKNKQLVLDFYNERRKQLKEVKPNFGHIGLVELEDKYNEQIITQNVDDLHERAGSKNILHLHGELTKVRSTIDPALIYTLDGWELKLGDKCAKGSQLRPHIVWFGEAVPAIEEAISIAEKADIFVVIGTSMAVYPAANLINYTPFNCKKYLIDPNDVNVDTDVKVIKEKASKGVKILLSELL
jgi:NAD-dependent deacetylase